jgi:hypothetical protein
MMSNRTPYHKYIYIVAFVFGVLGYFSAVNFFELVYRFGGTYFIWGNQDMQIGVAKSGDKDKYFTVLGRTGSDGQFLSITSNNNKPETIVVFKEMGQFEGVEPALLAAYSKGNLEYINFSGTLDRARIENCQNGLDSSYFKYSSDGDFSHPLYWYDLNFDGTFDAYTKITKKGFRFYIASQDNWMEVNEIDLERKESYVDGEKYSFNNKWRKAE